MVSEYSLEDVADSCSQSSAFTCLTMLLKFHFVFGYCGRFFPDLIVPLCLFVYVYKSVRIYAT